MSDNATLLTALQAHFNDSLLSVTEAMGELTVVLAPESLLSVCYQLRDNPLFQFEQLMDVCGVDYLTYGQSEWTTTTATGTGFERAVLKNAEPSSCAEDPIEITQRGSGI